LCRNAQKLSELSQLGAVEDVSLMGHLSLVAASTRDFLKRHPRSVAGGVLTVLGGFAVTAFGIAPLAPDAAQLPKQLITETVTPEGMQAQLEALAEVQLQLSRSDLTRASDTADTLLQRLGVADATAAAFLRRDPVARRLLEGRAGKMVQARADAEGKLLELVARYPAEKSEQANTHFTRLTLQSDGHGGWQSKLETAPLQAQVKLGSGTIRSSLFAATDDARIPDGVATQLAEMFSTDIDFHRELRKGDTFSVVYEALTADGEPITWSQGSGQVLAAEFVNDGKAYQALWYRDASGKGAYFDFNGQSKRRSFLASPMEFSRVTSGFAMRFHPIAQTWRRHLGVDYGAPTGTPVRSVGDGVVEFAGVQNGYGNVVILRHSNDRTTLYAHLSRIDVRQGQHVEQAQRIGAVGMTGWATGPHLHFEFRVHGQHQDPLKIAKSSETLAITPASRAQFASLARSAKAQLEVAATLAAGLSAGE
jgi:murein DD-endopeptidase MepM/ murein hydrolase activator NlpD